MSTADPFLSETDLQSCGDCPFVILACDGVWDVFSDQEAADMLLEHYMQHDRQPFGDAAQLLVRILAIQQMCLILLCCFIRSRLQSNAAALITSPQSWCFCEMKAQNNVMILSHANCF